MNKAIVTLILCLLPFKINGEIKNLVLKNNDFRVELELEIIDPNLKRELVLDGYVLYKNNVYRTNSSIPYNILQSAKLISGKIEIELPTAGIADCYHEEAGLSIENVLRVPLGDGMERLSILFAKGGGNDFVAKWIIVADKALFEEIEHCGDTYPEWYKRGIDENKK